jgi:Fur family ferric uptake transcriptional regulator
VTRAPVSPRLQFEDMADVVRAVRESGSRLTAPRLAVLEALFAADAPVAAEYIADGCGGRTARLDRVSVYRALEHLEELGVVRHVHLGHGPGLYALVGQGEREYLLCERCERVTAVEPERLDAVREQIRSDFGHHARFTHFPITGLCEECAKESGGSA